MKKKILIVIIVMSFLFCSYVDAQSYNNLTKKTIVIDPGHGGVDPGTIYNDVLEKDINLQISLILKELLEKENVNVIMTRNGDYDLSSPKAVFRKKSDFDNRISLINNSSADLYLSIHLNYLNDARYFGPQVFYLKDKKLADIMQENLNKISNSKRKIKMIPSDIYMFKKLQTNGLLIECGFLSNKDDRNKLINKEYQQKFAKTIITSLKLYFTQNSK